MYLFSHITGLTEKDMYLRDTKFLNHVHLREIKILNENLH